MSVRSKFTKPGTKVYHYSLQWDPTTLSWADVRGKILGPMDPAQAPAESLRGNMLGDWKVWGLTAQPDVGDNGVHALASLFKGLAEPINWLEVAMDEDPYGRLLLSAGLSIS